MNKEQAARLLASVLGKEVSVIDISLEDVVAVGLSDRDRGLLDFPYQTRESNPIFGTASYSQIKWVAPDFIHPLW